MLDTGLAELYGVTIGNLNKAVTRCTDRLCFLPNQEGIQVFKIPIWKLKQRTTLQIYATGFTEPGVAMLSSVLKSKRAAQVFN